jgi:hypothetical protein
MKCEICGKEIEKSKYLGMVICSTECFSVWFWNVTLDDAAIIINGNCYHDGGIKPSGYRGFMGYGGHSFTIKMNDGRVIHTNNLWSNGAVPKERHVEDNAVFIPTQADCLRAILFKGDERGIGV